MAQVPNLLCIKFYLVPTESFLQFYRQEILTITIIINFTTI